MWQWFLAGALVLVNAATVLIVVAVVRLHLRRAAGRDEADEPPRQPGGLPEDIEPRLAERVERLRGLLAEADQRIAELRRLREPARWARQGPGPADARQREVLRLARQQMGAVDIARQVDLDVGEVELLLSLYGSPEAGRA